MKKRSPYTLLGLVILICLSLGYIVFSTHKAADINPAVHMEAISFMIVGLPAFALYCGAFLAFWDKRTKLQVFKLRWLQEVVLQLGILGALIGIAFIATGATASKDLADFIPALGGGLATCLITIYYGFGCASLFYFIEKRLIATKKDELFKSRSVKSGFRLKSILGLLFLLLLLFGAIFIQGSMTDTNLMPMFFNLWVLCLIIAILLISIVIYGGQATIQALRLPFWRVNENDETLLSMLTVIRGNKRTTALLGLIFGFLMIIGGLRLLGWGTESFIILLVNFSSILVWCLVLNLFLNLAEGQVVQRIYFQTGEIHHEDRLFIVKFILPPFFLLYFSLWLVILFLLIA